MNVTACLVTRGNVDMQPILDSLPPEWEIIVWDNDEEFRQPTCYRVLPHHRDEIDETWKASELSVYGRYAAIEYASHDLIYVQDDDVIVCDPQAIVDAWFDRYLDDIPEIVVCNMPSEFRHDFYVDHALVGFGACFHRDTPELAFVDFHTAVTQGIIAPVGTDVFERTCDIVFTALTPRVLFDVPKTNLPYATGDDRMYRQPEHVGERKRMLELALKVRDGR